MKVCPDLDKVVHVAKEAKIVIRDIHFIRKPDDDVLEALSLMVDGKEDALGYFSYLLSKDNMVLNPAR